MDAIPMPDLFASAAYVSPVMVIMQAVKQSARWNNDWNVWASFAVGLLLALGGLWSASHYDLGRAFTQSPTLAFATTINGILGGGLAPLGYTTQKVFLGEKAPFQPGPDNYMGGQPPPQKE